MRPDRSNERGGPPGHQQRLSAGFSIKTKRLILDPATLDDFQDIHALWNDPATLVFLGDPSTEEEAWSRLLKYIGHWSAFGFGFWMLREATTGRYVGEAGLAYHKRNLGSDPEAGWALAGAGQGKGYAREALAAIFSWADVHLSAARTICLVDPANLASVRLAESIGFQKASETDLRGKRVILFERFANGSCESLDGTVSRES